MALSSKRKDFSVISIFLFVPLKVHCSGCLESPPLKRSGFWGIGPLRFFLVVTYLRKGVLQIVMKIVEVEKEIPEEWIIFYFFLGVDNGHFCYKNNFEDAQADTLTR